MPNWCTYTLTIDGPSDEIQRFLAGLQPNDKGEASILSSYFPMPEVLQGTVYGSPERESQCDQNYHAAIETGHANWFGWAIANWGVKSPDQLWSIRSAECYARCMGRAPLDPPLQGYTAVFGRFPLLTIRMEYEEPNMGFAGRATWRGDLVEHRTWHGDPE